MVSWGPLKISNISLHWLVASGDVWLVLMILVSSTDLVLIGLATWELGLLAGALPKVGLEACVGASTSGVGSGLQLVPKVVLYRYSSYRQVGLPRGGALPERYDP